MSEVIMSDRTANVLVDKWRLDFAWPATDCPAIGVGVVMLGRSFIVLMALSTTSPAIADSSCAEVNNIYDDSRSVSRYQVTMAWTPPGGNPINILLEQRYNGLDLFERDQAGNWSKHFRPYITTDSNYPTFSSCIRQPDTIVGGQRIITYTGDWQRGRRRANFVIRALAEAGHLLDVTRVMTLTDRGSPLDTKGVKAVEKFTYDRSTPNPTPIR